MSVTITVSSRQKSIGPGLCEEKTDQRRKGSLQEAIDQYNKTAAPQKKIYSLIVRDTEFEKTTTRKIKRF